jgi:hypothetical protein
MDRLLFFSVIAACLAVVPCCSQREIIESPKTAFVPESAAIKKPAVIWTSRSMIQDYDFLGLVKTRSLSYDTTFEELLKGAQELRADALIDIHYEQVGIFDAMQAFAVKYKN